MPNAWALIDSSFPTFEGDEKPKDQIPVIMDYMFLLAEGLRYQLSNLSAKNWNSNALENLQVETTAPLEEQIQQIGLQLTRLSNQVNGLSALSTKVGSMEETLTQLKDSAEEMQKTLDRLLVVVTPDGNGGATIGTAGQELRLLGSVYINGSLVTQEEN